MDTQIDKVIARYEESAKTWNEEANEASDPFIKGFCTGQTQAFRRVVLELKLLRDTPVKAPQPAATR